MLIVCKTCASSYHIPREILGENGCRLRCVGCGDTWAVTPGASASDDAPIEGERALIPPPRVAGTGAADHVAEFFHSANAAGRADEYSTPAPGRFWNRNGAGAALIVLAIVAGGMAAAAWRAPIVRAMPGAARLFAAIGLPVNLRGLALDNVRTDIFDLGDRRVLVVEGAIVNLRDSATASPNIRIALRGADKRELYVWTAPAPKTRLGPDEQVAFRTRLAAPPDGASDVMVRFASVGDRLSAMKDGL
jgi:predicted Zn finger-like uncharacterized protein